jgi:hypothetical protein
MPIYCIFVGGLKYGYMSLSKETIKNIQAVYFQDFGEQITEAEASELGERLIAFFKVIYPPTPNSDEEKYVPYDLL